MIADGIYPNTPAADYFSGAEWSGRMSPSTLEHAISQTFSHVKAAFDGQIKFDTPSLEFGRATHCRILEPDRFKADFAISEQCSAETKQKKQCSKQGTVLCGSRWLCSTHAEGYPSDREVVSQEEFDDIEAIRMRLFRHPAVNILKTNGGCEVAIAWTCPRTGVKLKSRLDKWMPVVHGVEYSMILDLKSVRSADARSISNAIEEYGWSRAAALRQDGLDILTGKRPEYCLICVEKTPPYELCVPIIEGETLRGARWEVRNLLAGWAKCIKENVYPGYGDEFAEISAPPWKLQYYRNLVPSDYGE